jgi:hypothetical protein
MPQTKQYIIHVWRGVEAKVVPVKGSVEKTLRALGPSEEDSVHLLEISAKGIPKIVEDLDGTGI